MSTVYCVDPYDLTKDELIELLHVTRCAAELFACVINSHWHGLSPDERDDCQRVLDEWNEARRPEVGLPPFDGVSPWPS
jgi:hypothetical protein